MEVSMTAKLSKEERAPFLFLLQWYGGVIPGPGGRDAVFKLANGHEVTESELAEALSSVTDLLGADERFPVPGELDAAQREIHNGVGLEAWEVARAARLRMAALAQVASLWPELPTPLTPRLP